MEQNIKFKNCQYKNVKGPTLCFKRSIFPILISKLGHNVLCTVLGVKQERKGEEKREKRKKRGKTTCKLGHIVLCTGGKTREKGKKNGKKGRRDGKKV